MVYMVYIPYIGCLAMPFLPPFFTRLKRSVCSTTDDLRAAAFTAISGITISLEEIHLQTFQVPKMG